MEPISLSNLNIGNINPSQGFVLGEMLRAMLGFANDPQAISVGVQAGAIPAPDYQADSTSPQGWLWKSTTVASLIATQTAINNVQSAVAAWRAKFPLPV
jgi:hypothetical protein